MILPIYTLNESNELYHGSDLLCTFTEKGLDVLIGIISKDNLVEYKGKYIRL
jgi:hypothetical protein